MKNIMCLLLCIPFLCNAQLTTGVSVSNDSEMSLNVECNVYNNEYTMFNVRLVSDIKSNSLGFAYRNINSTKLSYLISFYKDENYYDIPFGTGYTFNKFNVDFECFLFSLIYLDIDYVIFRFSISKTFNLNATRTKSRYKRHKKGKRYKH